MSRVVSSLSLSLETISVTRIDLAFRLGAPVALSRTRTLASARSFLEPVASGSGVLPEIDEISILDYEETWEHLDLDRLDLGVADGERSSEWDWERFSQF